MLRRPLFLELFPAVAAVAAAADEAQVAAEYRIAIHAAASRYARGAAGIRAG